MAQKTQRRRLVTRLIAAKVKKGRRCLYACSYRRNNHRGRRDYPRSQKLITRTQKHRKGGKEMLFSLTALGLAAKTATVVTVAKVLIPIGSALVAAQPVADAFKEQRANKSEKKGECH